MAEAELALDGISPVGLGLGNGREIGGAIRRMHEFEEGLARRILEGIGRLGQRPGDFRTEEKLALLRLPVPNVGPRACQRQRVAACLTEEVTRQIALRKCMMRQSEAEDDEQRREADDHHRGNRRAGLAAQRREHREHGPQQNGSPAQHHRFGLHLAQPPQEHDEAEPAQRREDKDRAGQCRGDQRFGHAIDRDGEGQASDREQQVTCHVRDARQVRQHGEQQQQEAGHQALDHGPQDLQGKAGDAELRQHHGEVPGLEQHEADGGQREATGHREHGARPEAVEREQG